ncbi:MAG TPA: hypothetical protein DDY49_14000 [Paenibacillaceae bacterium]|nr:hypothetical protein [Paenibacillaceae bacterium]
MFDPTIFENIKVVLEGSIYDLDLQGLIQVTNRVDSVDLSRMSRLFQLEFKLSEKDRIKAVIHLKADTYDLAGEILELAEHTDSIGCVLTVVLYTFVEDPEKCSSIEETLLKIWSYRPVITQEVSFMYQSGTAVSDDFKIKVTIDFHRKINESNMEDIEEILNHIVRSMDALKRI